MNTAIAMSFGPISMIAIPGADSHGTDSQNNSTHSDRERSPLYIDCARTQEIFSFYASGK